MTTPVSPDDWELLSAYLDGQVSARENEQVRLRLEAQPELQRALEELRRTRMVLRSVPRKRVPRNFILTRAMVPQRRPWFRLVPSLSFASGLATLLLVITFAFEFLPGLNNSFQPMAAQAPAPTYAALQAPNASESSPSSANQGAPIVIWGGGATGLGGGGGGGDANQALPEAGAAVTTPEFGIGGGPTSVPTDGKEVLPTEPAQVESTPSPFSTSNPSIVSAPSETPPELHPTKIPPAVQPTEAPAATSAPALAAPLTGEGPILGIRPTQEMGKIVIDQGADQTSRELASQQPTPHSTSPETSFVSRNLIVIQVGLVVLALVAGLAAFFLRRRF